MDGTPRLGTATRTFWVRYLIALVAGALLVIPAFAVLVVVLDACGAMPAPLIANDACVDEKLAFMRKNIPPEVNLLVVGSSSAMRNFNSPEAVRFDPTLRPYNAGLCALKLGQSEQVIEWLTRRLHGVRRVLLVVSLEDFGDFPRVTPLSLNVTKADRFVFGDTSRLSFYLQSFNATTLLRNATDVRWKRTDMTRFGSVVFNKFGDAPIQPPRDRRDWYLKFELDNRAFMALGRTARAMDARGVQLAVVESPMDPRWQQEFDRSGALTSLGRRKIREAISGTDAVFLEDRSGLSAADFYDAVHIRASSTPRFTRSVLSQLESSSSEAVRSARAR
jgi:hypothetical protein